MRLWQMCFSRTAYSSPGHPESVVDRRGPGSGRRLTAANRQSRSPAATARLPLRGSPPLPPPRSSGAAGSPCRAPWRWGEQLPELRVVLQGVPLHGQRQVVDGEEVLVVLQELEVLLPDKAARREHHAEVADLGLVRRPVDGVEGYLDQVFLRELEAVGPPHARQPVEAGAKIVVVVEAQHRLLGALLGEAPEVRDRLDAEIPAGLFARGDGIGVVPRGGFEPLDAVLFQVLPGHGLVLLPGVPNKPGLPQEDQPARGRVLPVEVYLFVDQRLAHLLVAAKTGPVYDRGVGGLHARP